MAAATMTRWSEVRTFYSFFMCFGLVLYWMILDLYWTCGELAVLLQGFCNIMNLELIWRLPIRGGSQNSHYIKNHTIHSSVNRCFYPRGTYIRRLTDEPISHMRPGLDPRGQPSSVNRCI
jgi:hypothetical protein